MSTNVDVEFVITGDSFNLDIITKELDIQPTEQWIKGELVPNRKVVRKDTCWSYSSGKEESLNINTQLVKLVQTLAPKKRVLGRVKEMFEVEYLILVTINVEDDVKPVITIKTPIIEFMNNISAELDVDLYIF